MRLTLAQTARPVLYGLVGGTGLAATLATVLLSTPLGAFISPIVHVTDPVAYLTSVLIIIAACVAAAALPAVRAARLDPVQALRQQ
jgi:ABC-type antimicrobial peptide transport system permease subunit